MKIAETARDFREALDSAQREAEKSFGDGTVLIEKYIPISRHVEVQVFADQFGEAVYLFERDCSVQRRHQKIIECAPSPSLVRHELEKCTERRQHLVYPMSCANSWARKQSRRRRQWATRALAPSSSSSMFATTHSSSWRCALVLTGGGFGSLACRNTRLQVEHPVTEMITGTDLVEWQLEVASGNALPLRQDELTCTGHAFEARIYAEKPRNNFLPDVGRLVHVRTPSPSRSVRIETGFEAGDEISVHYDPMIAKLVVHGPDRAAALRLLRKALGEYEVVGPSTNIEFLHTLASHPTFAAADVHTAFIPQHYDALFPPLPPPGESIMAAAALAALQKDFSTLRASSPVQTPWTSLAGRRFGGDRARLSYPLGADEKSSISLLLSSDGRNVDIATPSHTFTSVPLTPAFYPSEVDVTLEGARVEATVVPDASHSTLHVFSSSSPIAGGVDVPVRPPSWLAKLQGRGNETKGSARSPMPCRVVKVFVKEGEEVKEGQAVRSLPFR